MTEPLSDPANPPPIEKTDQNGLPAPVRIILKLVMYIGLGALVFWLAMTLILNYFLKDSMELYISGLFQQPTRIQGGISLGTDLAKPSLVLTGIDVAKLPQFPNSKHVEIERFEAGMPWQIVEEGKENLLSFFVKIDNIQADGKPYGSYEIPLKALPEGDFEVRGMKGTLKTAELLGDFIKTGTKLDTNATVTGLDYGQVVQGASGGDMRLELTLTGAMGADMAGILPYVNGKALLAGGAGKMTGYSLGFWSGSAMKSAITGSSKINCIIADLAIDKGIAKPNVLILDTEDATIYGQGYIDFPRQYADMVFTPLPKTEGANLAVPLNIYGPFSALVTTPDPATVAAKLEADTSGLSRAAMRPLPAAAAGENACLAYAKGKTP